MARTRSVLRLCARSALHACLANKKAHPLKSRRSTLLARLPNDKHTRSRVRSQHSTHACQMAGTPAQERLQHDKRACPGARAHTFSAARMSAKHKHPALHAFLPKTNKHSIAHGQHRAHAWQMRSTPSQEHAQHRTYACHTINALAQEHTSAARMSAK